MAVTLPGGRAAVFLDKDGTLVDDLPYNVEVHRIRFAPGAVEAVRRLSRAGYRLVVATNQSGIARGYFGEADLRAVERHIAAELERLGVALAGFYFCPHLPRGTAAAYAVVCDCRKPAPGLLVRAAAELGVDLARSWFVGDTWMDVACGRAAGCRTVLVGPEWRLAGTLPPARRPDYAVPDLAAAARAILVADGRIDSSGRVGDVATPGTVDRRALRDGPIAGRPRPLPGEPETVPPPEVVG